MKYIHMIYIQRDHRVYDKSQIPGFATLTEESSQTNVILQYKLLAAILSAVCSVIQQS